MGRDRYLPEWFGAVHPRYHTPFRAIVFLVPVAIALLPVLHDQPTLLATVITFSILSGLLMYSFMGPNVIRFRRLWPIGSITRGYVLPFHPVPAVALMALSATVFFATSSGTGPRCCRSLPSTSSRRSAYAACVWVAVGSSTLSSPCSTRCGWTRTASASPCSPERSPGIRSGWRRQTKELYVTPGGVRLVRQLAEGGQAHYRTTRRADFGRVVVTPGQLLPVLETLTGIGDVLAVEGVRTV